MRGSCLRRGSVVARLTLLGVCALCAGADCQRQNLEADYEALKGTVSSVRSDASELVVVAEDRTADRYEPRAYACLLTQDSEVYVDDRFTSVDAIVPGDTIQVIGYREAGSRESGSRGDRLVVTLAQITRTPAAAMLSEPQPLQVPSTQPQEK